ncbi:MAG TPA: hypothetical protein VF298_06090 [Bacteroidales bacterium]
METKQFGGVILYAMLGSIMLLVIIMLTTHEIKLPIMVLGIAIPAMAFAVLLFYNLSVKVTSEKVAIRFGIGLIRKSFAISDIETCTPVTNKWYYGWGIHFIGYTTIYYVSGIKAIEITFKGRRRKVRIGTGQPEELSRYINEVAHRRQR